MPELGTLVDNAEDLKPGDVLMVKVMLKDKITGNPFPWRRFACVVGVINHRMVDTVNLKLRPDPQRDFRTLHLRHGDEEVYRVDEAKWPEGVVATRMKLIATKVIKL